MNTWVMPEPKAKKEKTLKPWQEEQLKNSLWLEVCAGWDSGHRSCPQCKKSVKSKCERHRPDNFVNLVGQAPTEGTFKAMDKLIAEATKGDASCECGWVGLFQNLVPPTKDGNTT